MYVIACVHHIEGCEAVVSRGHWRHGCARRRINRDMQHLLYTTLLTQFCHRNHTLSTRRYDSNIMHTSKNSRSTRLSNQSIPNLSNTNLERPTPTQPCRSGTESPAEMAEFEIKFEVLWRFYGVKAERNNRFFK